MFQPSAAAHAPRVPEIADRVYCLHAPQDGMHRGDVVFVHGLNSDAFKCWTNRAGTLWPQVFLPSDFEHLRVLSVGYSHQLWGWGGLHSVNRVSSQQTAGEGIRAGDAAKGKHDISVEECANDVYQRLTCDAVGVGARPLVFVTHSMGGLVVKQMLVQQFLSLDAPAHRFLDQIEGVVFYATPHFGSPIASVVSGLEYFMGKTVSLSGVVTALGDHNVEQLQALNRQFLRIVEKKGMRLLSFGEGKKLNGLLMVVDAASANPAPNSPTHAFHIIPEDHTRLNTPETTREPSYTLLRDFVGEVLVDAHRMTRRIETPNTEENNTRHTETGSLAGPCVIDSAEDLQRPGFLKHHAALFATRSRNILLGELMQLAYAVDQRRQLLFGVMLPSEVSSVFEVFDELIPMALESRTARDDHRLWYPVGMLLFWAKAMLQFMDGVLLLRKERSTTTTVGAASHDSSLARHFAAASNASNHSSKNVTSSTVRGQVTPGSGMMTCSTFTSRESQHLALLLAGLRMLEVEWRAFDRAHDKNAHLYTTSSADQVLLHFIDSLLHICDTKARRHVVASCIAPRFSKDGSGPSDEDAVSMSTLSETAFLNGWYALLVTGDMPKARNSFDRVLELVEQQLPKDSAGNVDTDAIERLSTSHSEGDDGAAPAIVRDCCRCWVATIAAADTYTHTGTNFSTKMWTLAQMRDALRRAETWESRVRACCGVAAAAAPSAAAAAPAEQKKRISSLSSVTKALLKKPLQKIRQGGEHGEAWQRPAEKLLHNCTALDRAVRHTCHIMLVRRTSQRKTLSNRKGDSTHAGEAEDQLSERHCSTSEWCDASARLKAEVMASRSRLLVEAEDNKAREVASSPAPAAVASPNSLTLQVNEAIKTDPHNALGLLQRAKLLHDRRQYAAAAELYQEAVRECHTAAHQRSVLHTALVGLGWTHLQQVSGGVSPASHVFDLLSSAIAPAALVSALEDIQGAAISDTAEQEVNDARSLALHHVNRARDLFRGVLVHDPCQAWALCGLGRALTLVPSAESQRCNDGRVGSGAELAGGALVARERIVVARQYFSASWQLSKGRCHWATNWLGDCHVAQSRRGAARAVELYRMCLASHANNSWAMTSLGLLLQQETSPESKAEAVRLFTRASAADPGNTWALWALATAPSTTPSDASVFWRRLAQAAARSVVR